MRDNIAPGTLYSFVANRWDEKEERENVIDHAVKVLDLLIRHRKEKRPKNNIYGIKETWLGRRWAHQLSQPDNFCAYRVIRSERIYRLVQFRQLLVERRIGEAARILERLLQDSAKIPPALLWRAGFHLLARVSSHTPSAERWPLKRLRSERADSLDRFMFSIAKMCASIPDKENAILEYVLHCLADEDCERATHVMQFFKKDTLPNSYHLAREPEAIIVHYLRQCYIGLAYYVLWRRRCVEAKNQNSDDKHYTTLEAKKYADLGFSCLSSALPQLVALGIVVDVFVEPWCQLIKATGRQEEETGLEESLRQYSLQVERSGGSPNAHRFLAEWCESHGKEEEALTLWMKIAKRAPDDWSVVKKCLQHLSRNRQNTNARFDLLFNFLDHPVAAERNSEAWRCLSADLQSAEGVCEQWPIREAMWRAAYFNPQSRFYQKPEVVELEAVLKDRASNASTMSVNDESATTTNRIEEVVESPKSTRKRKLTNYGTPSKKSKQETDTR